MLLSEIKRAPLPSQTGSIQLDSNRFKVIGQGVGAGIGSGGAQGNNSKVYQDLKYPTRVVKVVPIRDTSDTYYKFIRMIELHQNNPFFPKIFGVKIYETSEHGSQYNTLVVIMEKLIPIDKIPEHIARKMLSTLGIDYDKEYLDFTTSEVTKEKPSHDRYKEFNKLTDNDPALNSRIFKHQNERENLRKNTQFPAFKQALRLLEPMFKRFGSDMHIGNLMIRKTNNGLQLVLVDPVYPKFEDWLD